MFVATKAGQCVSVDQLVSTQMGFIAQLKGTLTKKGYTVATIFVDHYSWLKYIHLMTKLTSEKTMDAKRAFEQVLALLNDMWLCILKMEIISLDFYSKVI